MRSVTSRSIAILLSGAAGLAFAAPAMAQSTEPAEAPADAAAEDDSSTSLGDIIVTARKVAENLQDVPVAVTAFSGEDLEKQNIQRLENLANFTPGLAMKQGSSSPT